MQANGARELARRARVRRKIKFKKIEEEEDN